ncbi:histidine ammonia-lyase [Candidatus Neomarinimicrobiota bacterium]
MSPNYIENKAYSLPDFKHFLKLGGRLDLSADAIESLAKSRHALEAIIAASDQPIYGIDTGFGKLSHVRIPASDHRQLQRNLLISHAVGVGEPLPESIVRFAIILKVISLVRGYSGIRPEVVQRLLDLINNDLIPIVPSKGSVGASGDLAPLAHMVLPLIGEGRLLSPDGPVIATEAHARLGWAQLELEAKEGLALINGTQISTAIALEAAMRLENLLMAADIIGALSCDGLMGTPVAYRPEVHALKEHTGQRVAADNLYRLMSDSSIRAAHLEDHDRVQDMYSLRCMPQVHGSCRDMVNFALGQLVNEACSVSDNPLVLIELGEVISAGHFHGEVTAMAADTASIAAAELANISERRIFALTAGNFGLPPFLISKPGLNSGFMMLQVTAAALASENKTLAHPASVDSIPTSGDQEDHVSMSNWAARKFAMIVSNVEHILAIELLSACQAIDFREGLKPGPGALAAYDLCRAKAEFLAEDRSLAGEIEAITEQIRSGELVDTVNQIIPIY